MISQLTIDRKKQLPRYNASPRRERLLFSSCIFPKSVAYTASNSVRIFQVRHIQTSAHHPFYLILHGRKVSMPPIPHLTQLDYSIPKYL